MWPAKVGRRADNRQTADDCTASAFEPAAGFSNLWPREPRWRVRTFEQLGVSAARLGATGGVGGKPIEQMGSRSRVRIQ